MTDNNLVQQIQEQVAIGLGESSKRLPVLGVQNAEFPPLNPEIAALYQSSTLDAMKVLENADSIELKSIDKETNKQTKNQILEMNMTKLIDENCGCPKRQTKTEELNELDDKISDGIEIAEPYIHVSDVQAAESMITNQDVATQSIMLAQVHPASCGDRQFLVYVLACWVTIFGARRRELLLSRAGRAIGRTTTTLHTANSL